MPVGVVRVSRRRKHDTASRVPWGRFAALGLVLATGLALLWIYQARPVLGVRGQHVYPYHPRPLRRTLAVLALASLPLLAGAAAVVLRRTWTGRRQEWRAVGVLVAGSLVLHAAAATAPKVYPGIELGWPFLWTNTEGAYADWAGRLGPMTSMVSNYPHLIEVSLVPGSSHHVKVHHPQVHPPGLIVAFAWADGLYEASPGLEAAVTGAARAVVPSASVLGDWARTSLRHPLAVSMTAALAAILLASAAPLAVYLALRAWWPAETVLAAAALSALVPGTYLFNPGVDQAYPVVVVVLGALFLRTVASRRWPWGLAFGAALYGAMFVHVGFALAVGIMGLAAGVAWRASKPRWGPAELMRLFWRPAAAAALGFLTPAFVLQVWLGYPTFRVILTCLRNNRLFNEQVARTWWPWVAVTPLEFMLSLGIALGLVCVVGWVCEVAGAVRQGSLRGRAALLLSAMTVLAALDVLGMNRGETARLWLFLTPLLVVGAAPLLGRMASRRRVLLALAFSQWLQVLLLRALLDPGWTSTFIIENIQKP